MDSINIFKTDYNPLVSIIVITYNSAKYVLETLESAKKQTYQNIELIISDDCSIDGTVEICRNWLAENKEYFTNTELLTVDMNSGIPANCNRGVEASSGEWIKLIAGDDILLENCINDFVEFTKENKTSKFIFSDFIYINEKSKNLNRDSKINRLFFDLIPEHQHRRLQIGFDFMVPALTGFINEDALKNLEYFDEEIKFCEDYPMWIKATNMGYHLSYMPVKTAKYRIHSNSITGHFNKRYHSTMRKIFFKYRLRYLLRAKPLLAIELIFYNLFRENKTFHKYSYFLLPSNYINRLHKFFS